MRFENVSTYNSIYKNIHFRVSCCFKEMLTAPGMFYTADRSQVIFFDFCVKSTNFSAVGLGIHWNCCFSTEVQHSIMFIRFFGH